LYESTENINVTDTVTRHEMRDTDFQNMFSITPGKWYSQYLD